MHRLRPCVPIFIAVALVALPAAAFADTSFNDVLGQLEQMYQLPGGILAKVAIVENGGKATGCAPTSSACGMFQWTTQSWLAATKALFGQPYDLSQRDNPSISAKVTAFALADARSKLGGLIQSSGIDMTVGLYLSHFLGIGGAQKFLTAYMQDPSQNACAIFPKGCAANGSVLQRPLAGVVNYFAQKLKAPGVLNVPGNFADTNGISYAYSYADLNANGFLSASTIIGQDPTLDYPQTFTPAATSPALPPTGTSLPQLQPQTTPSPSITPTLATSTATSSSACKPQYYCSNNTVYYSSDSCTTSIFQQCQYGCRGTICAPAPASTTSPSEFGSLTNATSISPLVIPGVARTLVVATTAAPIIPLLNSTVYTIIPGQDPWQSAGSSSNSQMGGAPSYTPTYANTTLTPISANPAFVSQASPLFRILDQLRSVLIGVENYLQTL